jgi:hypothetical protein
VLSFALKCPQIYNNAQFERTDELLEKCRASSASSTVIAATVESNVAVNILNQVSVCKKIHNFIFARTNQILERSAPHLPCDLDDVVSAVSRVNRHSGCGKGISTR